MKKYLPIYQIDGEKDERFAGVKLLGIIGDDKTTAEDCGMYWHIRDWEIDDLRGYGQCWVSRSGYTIDKGILAELIKITVAEDSKQGGSGRRHLTRR